MIKAEKFWNRLAKDIDKESDQLDEEQLQAIKNIEKYFNTTDVVLDYGCARGGITVGIADKVKEVHGIDISSKMIAIANQRAVNRKTTNVYFYHAQITDKRLKPASFNVILIFNVLHLVAEPEMVLQRLYELLKPGGSIIMTTPCLGERKHLFSTLANLLLHFVIKIGIVPPISFFKTSVLEKMFTNEKFELIKSKSLPERLTISQFIVAKKL